jgi:glycyl-tRNA synthetase (class II)
VVFDQNGAVRSYYDYNPLGILIRSDVMEQLQEQVLVHLLEFMTQVEGRLDGVMSGNMV